MFVPNEEVVKAAEAIKDPKLKAKAEEFLSMLANAGGGIAGEEEDGFQIPFLRLIQGTTKPENIPEGASAGMYVIGSGINSEVIGKEVKFYMLSVQKGRTYFRAEDGNDANVRLYCWSPDRVVGKLRACEGCPFAEKDENGKTPCTITIPMIGLTADFEYIFQFTFAKTGFMEGTKISKMLRTPKGKKATYDMPWSLTSASWPQRQAIRVPVVNALSNETIPEDVHEFLRVLSNQIVADHLEFIRLFREQVNHEAPALEHHPEGETVPTTQKLAFDVDA